MAAKLVLIFLIAVAVASNGLSLPHLHRKVSFYIHHSGQNSSSSSTFPSKFGNISVIDEAIRGGRSNTSFCIGRLQGYSVVDNDASSTLYHLTSEFNTSYLKGGLLLQGRTFPKSRNIEISAIGTSGIFRFARGYSLVYMGIEENVDYVENYLYKF